MSYPTDVEPILFWPQIFAHVPELKRVFLYSKRDSGGKTVLRLMDIEHGNALAQAIGSKFKFTPHHGDVVPELRHALALKEQGYLISTRSLLDHDWISGNHTLGYFLLDSYYTTAARRAQAIDQILQALTPLERKLRDPVIYQHV